MATATATRPSDVRTLGTYRCSRLATGNFALAGLRLGHGVRHRAEERLVLRVWHAAQANLPSPRDGLRVAERLGSPGRK